MGGPPPKPELSNYIASEDVQKVEKRQKITQIEENKEPEPEPLSDELNNQDE